MTIPKKNSQDIENQSAADITAKVDMSDQESPTSSEALFVHQQHITIGPLPPPETLRSYDEIVPGAADRIMKMAEQQAAHRQELERQTVTATFQIYTRGQWFGLLIGVFGLAAAVIIAIYGSAWAGTIIGGTTLVGLVSAFLYGQSPRSGLPVDVQEETPEQDRINHHS